MEWLSILAHVTNISGVVSFLVEATGTELAFLLLSSKPVFVAAAVWVGFWSRRTMRLHGDAPAEIPSETTS